MGLLMRHLWVAAPGLKRSPSLSHFVPSIPSPPPLPPLPPPRFQEKRLFCKCRPPLSSSTHHPINRKLIIYSKPGCCLCDNLKEKLQAVFLLGGQNSLSDVQLESLGEDDVVDATQIPTIMLAADFCKSSTTSPIDALPSPAKNGSIQNNANFFKAVWSLEASLDESIQGTCKGLFSNPTVNQSILDDEDLQCSPLFLESRTCHSDGQKSNEDSGLGKLPHAYFSAGSIPVRKQFNAGGKFASSKPNIEDKKAPPHKWQITTSQRCFKCTPTMLQERACITDTKIVNSQEILYLNYHKDGASSKSFKEWGEYDAAQYDGAPKVKDKEGSSSTSQNEEAIFSLHNPCPI